MKNDPLINGIIKWLETFYGNPEQIQETESLIAIGPFEYFDHRENRDLTNFKFLFDKSTGSLTYHWEVLREIQSYFGVGGLTSGYALETWFQRKFGYEVTWLGNWS